MRKADRFFTVHAWKPHRKACIDMFRTVAVTSICSYVLFGAATIADAGLNNSFQFNGKGNWSLDAVGGSATGGGAIAVEVPLGSVVERAFLYASNFAVGTPPSVNFDGTVLAGSDFTSLGAATSFLEAWRAEVTGQVAAKVGSGSASPFSFQVTNPSPNTDGFALAVVFSNPAEQERTVAFLDGFSPPAGNTTSVNLAEPLDLSEPGFEVLMSLGIGFGAQGFGQQSNVDTNGRRLTSSAGGQDDGALANGALITIGGIGDDPANPPDPFALPQGDPRIDDELYDLALGNAVDPSPFVADGDTTITVFTQNPSNDDNIFFLGVNITAVAGVDEPPPVVDTDGDGVPDDQDNCPDVANVDQADSDGDGIGDVCEPDGDADGVIDDIDNCVSTPNANQLDTDNDGEGDACDLDDDGDGVDDTADNCPLVPNSDQADLDNDGQGDACDADVDGDGVNDAEDQCLNTAPGDVTDANGCSVAQICPCENEWKNHGAYVSCVAHASEDFLDLGLITEAEKDAIVSEAGQSQCGHKK